MSQRASSRSPLATVKAQFGDKKSLVKAVEAFCTEDLWLGRLSRDRGGEAQKSKKGLDQVSNAKLLRLHRIFSDVKEQFGSRDKLIGAILTLEKREKDDGYKARLGGWPVPRLFDHYRRVKKRATDSERKSA